MRIFFILTLFFSVISSALAVGQEFDLTLWDRMEEQHLLTDSQYRGLLRQCISDLKALDEWRAELVSTTELQDLSKALAAAVANEDALNADTTATRSAKRTAANTSRALRKKIEGFWGEAEVNPEFVELKEQAAATGKSLYDYALSRLDATGSPEALECAAMLRRTSAIGIPRLSRLEEVAAYSQLAAESPAPAMDDVELFKYYEHRMLMQNPLYARKKREIERAFMILHEWQNNCMATTKEGVAALQYYTNAVNAVKRNTETASERAAAQRDLQLAVENLRRTQGQVLAGDRHNAILTQHYLRLRGEITTLAIETLRNSTDPRAVALADRLEASNSIMYQQSELAVAEATAPVAQLVSLDDWERRYLGADNTYLELKVAYIKARTELEEYQYSKLSATEKGADIYNKVAELDHEIGYMRRVDAAGYELGGLLEARAVAMKELEDLYKEHLSNDAENKALQRKNAAAKKAMTRYAAKMLKANGSSEALVIAEELEK